MQYAFHAFLLFLASYTFFGQDSQLKSEMPRSLSTIEKAANYLEQACHEMKADPYSKDGRDRLITGSRGILQVRDIFRKFV